MNRGDVVLADFPFQDMSGSKIRPAVLKLGDEAMQKVNGGLVAALGLG
jgi:hypothetical protein